MARKLNVKGNKDNSFVVQYSAEDIAAYEVARNKGRKPPSHIKEAKKEASQLVAEARNRSKKISTPTKTKTEVGNVPEEAKREAKELLTLALKTAKKAATQKTKKDDQAKSKADAEAKAEAAAEKKAKVEAKAKAEAKAEIAAQKKAKKEAESRKNFLWKTLQKIQKKKVRKQKFEEAVESFQETLITDTESTKGESPYDDPSKPTDFLPKGISPLKKGLD